MVQFLLQQLGLKQVTLSRSSSRCQVSDLVNGKRGISKAQARKLAQFFHVAAEVFN
jgi:HTH-type transcriptional regulator/antitoxin HigA